MPGRTEENRIMLPEIEIPRTHPLVMALKPGKARNVLGQMVAALIDGAGGDTAAPELHKAAVAILREILDAKSVRHAQLTEIPDALERMEQLTQHAKSFEGLSAALRMLQVAADPAIDEVGPDDAHGFVTPDGRA